MKIKLLKDTASIGLKTIPVGTEVDATVSKCQKYARFYYGDEVTTIGLVNFGTEKHFQQFEVVDVSRDEVRKLEDENWF